jgi:phosphoglycolate phosphatase
MESTIVVNTVIFDLDGTLADTMLDLMPVLNRTTAIAGLPPIEMADVAHVVGHGAKAMIARAFAFHGYDLPVDLHERLFERFLEDYEDNIAIATVLFDGVTGALEHLHDRGYHLGVCTNKREFLARKLLDRLGVLNYFSAVTGGDSFAWRKPDARHLIDTISMAGGHPDHTIMVGDSDTDIATARNASIPVIAVDFGYCERPVADFYPDTIISSFHELLPAIDRLHEKQIAGQRITSGQKMIESESDNPAARTIQER